MADFLIVESFFLRGGCADALAALFLEFVLIVFVFSSLPYIVHVLPLFFSH